MTKRHLNSAHRYELISCALNGHETFKPVGSKKSETIAEKLSIKTHHGQAWRCLRCGNYVEGKPRYENNLEHAPLVLRGKILRQAFILRFLAFERGVRGLFVLLLGFALIEFGSKQQSLSEKLDRNLPAFKDLADSLGYNLDSSNTLHVVENALKLGKSTLTLVTIGIFVYALIQLTEAIGLWLMKRWGEYLSAVATTFFIPLEIYEIAHHTTVLKIGALLINVIAVAYLVLSKRLFGVRGGAKAYEKDLQGENLLKILDATN